MHDIWCVYMFQYSLLFNCLFSGLQDRKVRKDVELLEVKFLELIFVYEQHTCKLA